MSRADALFVKHEALAALDVSSIARGIVALDQLAKRAETEVVAARSFSPGRYFILIAGAVGEVEEALGAGALAAADDLLDQVIVRDPHPGLLAILANHKRPALAESLLIVETPTLSRGISFLDRGLKGAEVEVLELRLGAGLSGKAVFTLTGALHMIEAAKEVLASGSADPAVRLELIANPHPDLPAELLSSEPALPRGGID